ncbi:type II secretion system minor pseudopilin GspJ [Pleionea sp. CnH1-48]|uniref:type II secretion system minor pseudopilin GspJ n=1 Tax=Pleionea sp. CnH1-48 TaxID=2954494 RepID=UPI002097F1A8|nr:type II secretion system minor pseudopilin GspJ [Pleionea sp. CnH1-48]MCO7225198.1 type II secretion system minor pseudopilin GspJ [Pleionea sp. CnH1-48]
MADNRGFTLLEMLIAVAITAFIAVSAYSVLNSALATQKSAKQSDRRLAELQRAMNRIAIDFQQLVIRTVRDENGDPKAVMIGEKDGDASRISWTRQGKLNPAQLPRTEMERLSYRVSDDALVREQWLALDIASEDQKVERPILSDVKSLVIEYYSDEQWHEDWPIDQDEQVALHQVPEAVKMKIELNDFGLLEQVYIIPSGPKKQRDDGSRDSGSGQGGFNSGSGSGGKEEGGRRG